MKIANASNLPLFWKGGSVPDVSGALQDYYQPLVFVKLAKIINGFQVVENPTSYNFQGAILPFSERQLLLKPEGQRAWSWYWIFADPVLELQVDDIVTYTRPGQDGFRDVQTRIMSRKNYSMYGYVEYSAIEDWQNAGPL